MWSPVLSTVNDGPSPDKQKLLRLHVTASLHPIEVYAACQIGGVELDFVVAGVDVGVDKLGYLLAECVEYGKRDVRAMRNCVTNGS